MSLFIRANSCLLPSSRVFGSLGGQSKQYTKPVAEKRTENECFKDLRLSARLNLFNKRSKVA